MLGLTLGTMLYILGIWVLTGLNLFVIALLVRGYRVGMRGYSCRFNTATKVYLMLVNLPLVIVITVFGLPYWFMTRVVLKTLV